MQIMRCDRHVSPKPVVYQPRIVVVAQGQKCGYLDGACYPYNAENYLVVAVPLPFQCETRGTPEEPMLALSVAVEPAILRELLLLAEEPTSSKTQLEVPPLGISSTKLDPGLRTAAERLAEVLESETDTRVLGHQLIREIVYRVLRGPQGGILRGLAAQHSHFEKISKVLRRMHQDCAEDFFVEEMARELDMSTSLFHQSFKAVTSCPPLQYLKTMRLHKARELLLGDTNVTEAATAVGYHSPSQFSREFKRLFGHSPRSEFVRLRG